MRITISYLIAIAVATICVRGTSVEKVQEEGQQILPQMKTAGGKHTYFRNRSQCNP